MQHVLIIAPNKQQITGGQILVAAVHLLMEGSLDDKLQLAPAVMLMLPEAPRLGRTQRLQHVDIARSQHIGTWKTHGQGSFLPS